MNTNPQTDSTLNMTPNTNIPRHVPGDSQYTRHYRLETGVWLHCCFQSKTKIDPIHAISIGCVEVSLKCPVAAIIVITTSGLSAKIIAQYRPKCPVLAIVRHGKYARKLCVWRNLISVHYIGKYRLLFGSQCTHLLRRTIKTIEIHIAFMHLKQTKNVR